MTIVEMLGQFGISPLLSAVIISTFLTAIAVIVLRVGSRKPVHVPVVQKAVTEQPAAVAGSIRPQVIAAVTAAINEYSAQVTAAISVAVREYRKSL